MVGDFTATGSSLSGSTSYDPWGTVTAVSGTQAGRLGYQSQYTDPVSGQVDMGARWYDPARDGFDNADTAGVDPVPDEAAANPFAYAGDNPLNGIDPTGHSVMMLCGGGTCGSVANQQATHPCDSACEASPPQTDSAALLQQLQQQDDKLKAEAAARERAARERAKAKRSSSCSDWDLLCDAKKAADKATHLLDKARHDVAAAADDLVHDVSGASGDFWQSVLRPGWALVVRAGRDTVNAVKDAAQYGIHAAGTAVSYAAQAGSRAYHAVTRAAAAAGHAVVHAVRTAYHAVRKAVTATVAFVKHHAAAITSLVVGVTAFAGCEAATLGVGSVGCAAIAGALGNMAGYAVTAAQTGHFSAGGLLMSGVTGALAGAATAGLLEGAAGLAGGLLGSAAEDAADGLADGALADAAGDTSEAAAQTADDGGEAGDEDAAARDGDDDDSETGCAVGGQSFTAGTRVLLASGAAVPISRLKAGEKVLATSTTTGKTRAETVTAVLVHHDTDRYDLKIRAGRRTRVIDTTSNHLFWDASTGRWVKAGALKYGTHLRTPGGGTATVLGGYTPKTTTGWMWDLTITPSHDFYVQTAATAILVHNDCGPGAEAVPGQVGYGSTDLSHAVQEARIAANDTSGNYAAGRLEDGTIVIGRSGAELHAEEDVIQQAGGRQIEDLYSEREPCAARCAALTQDMNVTWSWPWNPPAVRATTNAAIRAAIRGLFG